MDNHKNSFVPLIGTFLTLTLVCLFFSSFSLEFPNSTTCLNINYTTGLDTIKPNEFEVSERMPRFPGCEDELGFEEKDKLACAQKRMLEFLYSNLTYPIEARKQEIEGTAVVTFRVTKKGEIADATISREIGGGCGTEALRIVNLMPDWLPGFQDKKYIEVEFNLPIKFELEPKKKKRKRKKRNKN